MKSKPDAFSENLITFTHRSHDYRWLIKRWRAVAKTSKLILRQYYEEDGLPYFLLESLPSKTIRPSVYLSAGIHGDEPAATEALVEWAIKHAHDLHELELFIFPCLNPWGLINNQRTDAQGVDRNRSYHDHLVPATAAHLKEMGNRRFDLALTLHEDYDACGLYLYEISHKRPYWGRELLDAAGHIIASDGRRIIDTSRPKQGVIRRRITAELMEHHPEAFILHFRHALRTFTIETPSEYALPTRTTAQVAVIEQAIELLKRSRETFASGSEEF